MSRPDDTLPLDDAFASGSGLRALTEWLRAPASADAGDELPPLRTHLLALREASLAAPQRQRLLDLLHARARAAIVRLLPELEEVVLPLPRRLRQRVRGMQDVLQLLAEDYAAPPGPAVDAPPAPGPGAPTALRVWRALDALALHLRISYLAAAPAGIGIWRQMHDLFLAARQNGLAQALPEGVHETPQEIYLNAALLACAQPASFNSGELTLAAAIVSRFGNQVSLAEAPAPEASDSVFWIDPLRDAPPLPATRVPPPADATLHFDCAPLALLLEQQLGALESGSLPQTLDLPDAVAAPAGRAVLRRLVHYWGQPGKRRFPRRRQSYRAQLCSGLSALWRLFREGDGDAVETSSWMITNESPDGYAVMHVAGKTRRLAVGDVVALRTESGSDWQICLVRWAMSENPEHLELGLQILAPRAQPALLAVTDGTGAGERRPVLILPRIPTLRPEEAVIAPSGTTEADTRMVLLIERENLEVREIRPTHLDEQTGSVEIFSIETDAGP